MPQILIFGYSEAAMFLKQPEASNVRAILSIRGQREFAVEAPNDAQHLVLEFDDTESPSATDLLQASRIRLRQREAASIGLTPTPPSRDHARAIIGFAESIRHLEGAVVFHCFAGISRSPAAALLSVAAWLGAGRERECVEYIRMLRPAAVPHRDLIAFGDDLLERDGRLIKAACDLR